MKKTSVLLFTLILLTAFHLLVRAQQPAEKSKLNVAILLFEGVQIIDYTGPYEVFGQARANVYTVAEKSEPLTTAMGMTVVPKYNFENNPKPDVVVVPGGAVGQHWENPKVIKWIQDNAKDAKYVLSVCNGAFFLAKAGLLDGLEATTTAGLIADLKMDFPKTKVVTDKRFVDNGKLITAGGLSAGIEGALHVDSKLYGEGAAQAIALGIEYHWDRSSKFLPATLARKYVKPVRQSLFPFNAISYSATGTQDWWEEVFNLTTEISAEELVKQLTNKLSSSSTWTKKQSATAHVPTTTLWEFTDENGKHWNATVDVQSAANEKNKLVATVRLTRA
jgi:putative intracellular protease/amidase